jgi:3-deoxy-D-manno-octulosonate 8-phosphate phosphatase (KDO 8-P phosphatase)
VAYKHSYPKEVIEKASHVRLVIFDVDGVLTDGRLYYGADGEALKVFHTQDGHAIKMLIASGVDVAIISGRESAMVERRALDLGIGHVRQGVLHKAQALEQLSSEAAVALEAMAHVGDDLPDLPIMLSVGLSIAVADAHPLVRDRADWVTSLDGGRGAAREACELVMHAQGTLSKGLATYLNASSS